MSLRPTIARFTHIALPRRDIDATIVLVRAVHAAAPAAAPGRRRVRAWLGQPDMVDKPFIVVLVSFFAISPKGPSPTLAPFAHLGIELPSQADVTRWPPVAEEGCLVWEPQPPPAPVGYVWRGSLTPDGNVVQFELRPGRVRSRAPGVGWRRARAAGGRCTTFHQPATLAHPLRTLARMAAHPPGLQLSWIDGEAVAWQPGRGVYGGNLHHEVARVARRPSMAYYGSTRVLPLDPPTAGPTSCASGWMPSRSPRWRA